MTVPNLPESADATERHLNATPDVVFSAFSRPELLTQWWGPEGFRSTFKTFDFVPGGDWTFTFHGPNGANYPNELKFAEIEQDRKVVLDHFGAHPFVLTITLEPEGAGTRLVWVQDHGNKNLTYENRAIFRAANEQNLDRLEAVLAAL